MKKFIITIGVIGFYVIYSVGIRHQQPVLNKPATLATSSGSSSKSNSGSSNTPSSSSGSAGNGPTPSTTTASQYKDGTYTGSVAYVYYGNVQVSVTISGGKITDVKFLQYPNAHSTSVYINQQAMPYLKQEAIQSQSSNVQLISGATYTAQGFVQSLQSALAKA